MIGTAQAVDAAGGTRGSAPATYAGLSPFRIVALYALAGGLWILFSDRTLESLVADPHLLTRIAIIKGWAFVLVTTLLLYGLLKRYDAALRAEADRQRELTRRIASINETLEARVAERTEAAERRARDLGRAVEEIGALNGRLEEANRELEAFSYSVSHDLRAPLRGIDGFSRALLEDCGESLGEEGKEHLRRVRGAAHRMGRIIDGLLDLSKVGRAGIRVERIDLSALAAEIAADLAKAHPGRDVEVVIAEGLAGEGDGRLLRQAIQNLLDNAWKFTSRTARPRVEFGVERSRGETVYFVRDNGAGFDPRYGANLFGPFQRLHAADDFPGSGVGLATVQRIVHRHGGRVWAEGAPGLGATFRFTLPDRPSGQGGPGRFLNEPPSKEGKRP